MTTQGNTVIVSANLSTGYLTWTEKETGKQLLKVKCDEIMAGKWYFTVILEYDDKVELVK